MILYLSGGGYLATSPNGSVHRCTRALLTFREGGIGYVKAEYRTQAEAAR